VYWRGPEGAPVRNAVPADAPPIQSEKAQPVLCQLIAPLLVQLRGQIVWLSTHGRAFSNGKSVPGSVDLRLPGRRLCVQVGLSPARVHTGRRPVLTIRQFSW
jgi:hypothetical protein